MEKQIEKELTRLGCVAGITITELDTLPPNTIWLSFRKMGTPGMGMDLLYIKSQLLPTLQGIDAVKDKDDLINRLEIIEYKKPSHC